MPECAVWCLRTGLDDALQCTLSNSILQSWSSSLLRDMPMMIDAMQGQEDAEFDNFLEEPLANYLRRGVQPLFSPTVPACA